MGAPLKVEFCKVELLAKWSLNCSGKTYKLLIKFNEFPAFSDVSRAIDWSGKLVDELLVAVLHEFRHVENNGEQDDEETTA